MFEEEGVGGMAGGAGLGLEEFDYLEGLVGLRRGHGGDGVGVGCVRGGGCGL